MASNDLHNSINQAAVDTREHAVQALTLRPLSGEHFYCPAPAWASIVKGARDSESQHRDLFHCVRNGGHCREVEVVKTGEESIRNKLHKERIPKICSAAHCFGS